MKISNIKINGIKNPIGYGFEKISVSCLVTETNAKRAVYSKVEVSRTENFDEIIYMIEDVEPNLAGMELEFTPEARTRYYVRVSVKADNGDTAINEEPAFFETSKIEEAWTGIWIKPQEGDAFHPEFHKSFEVSADKEIEAARLYISGLGLYHATMNGTNVTNEVLTPYYSNYHYEVQYQTYDVTSLLKADGTENEICVQLGNGWYKGSFGLQHQENNFGSEFALLAEVRILYRDGTEKVIGTDESWYQDTASLRLKKKICR